jgi:hypothetical protein
MNINWSALISAIISIGTVASMATGHPALGAVISDPTTATALTGLVGVVGGVVSALSQGVQHPATAVTVPAVAVNVASPALTPSQKATVKTVVAKID